MDWYQFFKLLHILSAFSLVGPLLLAPKWLSFSDSDMGRSVLKDLHTLTGISGWIVLILGGIMIALQKGEILSFFWMQLSIFLFLSIQLLDHFWADRREKELEDDPEMSISFLKIWLIIKIGLYFFITFCMVLKPQF